jgi:hypothetical protein
MSYLREASLNEGSWIINTLPHKLVWWHGIKLMRWEVMRGSSQLPRTLWEVKCWILSMKLCPWPCALRMTGSSCWKADVGNLVPVSMTPSTETDLSLYTATESDIRLNTLSIGRGAPKGATYRVWPRLMMLPWHYYMRPGVLKYSPNHKSS